MSSVFSKKPLMFLQITHISEGYFTCIRGPVTAKLLCPIVFFDTVTLRSVVSHANRKARVHTYQFVLASFCGYFNRL